MGRLVTPIVLLALLAPAAPALAKDRAGELLVDACRDEHVDGTYSQADYVKALREIPADTDEYTACRDVIRRAQLAAAAGSRGRGGAGSGGAGSSSKAGGSGGGSSQGGGGSGGSGSSSGGAGGGAADAPPTPAEQKALAAAGKSGAPVQLAGVAVKPGETAAAAHDLPTSVLVLVGLIAAAVLGGLGWGAWSRVRARRAG